MTAVIFAGPSIHGLDLPSAPNLVFRPPATQGDVFRATLARSSGYRHHRRLFRRRAFGLAQGDPVGAVAGRARLRRRQHGGAAGGGARQLRDDRRRTHLRVVSRRRSRGRRRGRPDPRAGGGRFPGAQRAHGQCARNLRGRGTSGCRRSADGGSDCCSREAPALPGADLGERHRCCRGRPFRVGEIHELAPLRPRRPEAARCGGGDRFGRSVS